MEAIKYRKASRIGAYIELGMGTIAVVFISIILFLLIIDYLSLDGSSLQNVSANATSGFESVLQEILDDYLEYHVVVIKETLVTFIVFTTLILAIAIIEVFTAIQLVQATSTKANLEVAVRKVTLWKRGFLLISFVSVAYLAVQCPLFALPEFLLRGVFFLIVYKFSQQMNNIQVPYAQELLIIPKPQDNGHIV